MVPISLDAATGKKWSDFTATKADFVEHTAEWMNQMKQWGPRFAHMTQPIWREQKARD
jgi:hypothetical protein